MSQGTRVAVPYLTIAGYASAKEVAGIRKRVRDFAAEHGASEREVFAIAHSVGEAVVNAVVHGYGGAGGEVRVEVDLEDGDIEVVVADGGHGFTTAPSEGLGLGLAFVRAGSTAFEIRDRPLGGVELWMRFALAGG
jgi:anti-sigma regulatory factor (Ser/Thr protein kinase)